MKKYNVAIIGTGLIANKFHIPAFKKNKQVNELILFDINRENLSKTSKKHKIKKVYMNFKKMITENNIDILNICTPPYLHLKYINEAIKNKIHIFVEKPFVINSFQLKSLETKLKKSKIHFYCAYHQRFRPVSEELKKIIKRNIIGDVYFINIVHRKFRSIPNQSKYFSKSKFSGGGPLIDLGSHYFDLVGWVLNYPKNKKISNYCFSHISKMKNNKKILPFKFFDNEELAVGNIELNNKYLISYELGYLLNAKKELRFIEFFGTKGSFNWPQGEISILKKNKILQKKIKITNYLASERQVDFFLKKLEDKHSMKNFNEIKFSVELIDKLYKFSKT